MEHQREIIPGPDWAPNYQGPLLTWDEFLYRNPGGGSWVAGPYGADDEDER